MAKRIKDFFGTLPDWVIIDYIEKGYIKVAPLDKNWKQKVDPVSIDFHLGKKVMIPKSEQYRYVDVKKGVNETWYDEIALAEGEPFLLQPGQFIIAQTKEKLEIPGDIVAKLDGKSSLARIGVVVHLTAGRFDPGWIGNPVLELKNNSAMPVIIYEGWPICAFMFERLQAPVKQLFKVRGKYLDNSKIHSLVHLDRDN